MEIIFALLILFIMVIMVLYWKFVLLTLFNCVTDLYTFFRLYIEPYNPFKPVLQIHRLRYYYGKDSQNYIGASSVKQLLNNLRNTTNDPPLALSIVYSFSNWNERFVKLVDLRMIKNCKKVIPILEKEVQIENSAINYDYIVKVISDSIPDENKVLIEVCLSAYLRRASTYDNEQTLSLLSECPNIMEFIYSCYIPKMGLIDSLFGNGKFSYHVADDLGTEYMIQCQPKIQTCDI